MIVIVDYGLGNLASVANMFKKAGIKNVYISSDKKVIAKRQIIDRIKHHTTQSLDATSYSNSFNMFFIELK